MTVEEVKELTREADVYRLDGQSRYLIVLKKSEVGLNIVRQLGEAVKAATGNAPIILSVTDPQEAVRLLKVSE